ncbi:intraflagellar transport-associated protein isoform X1 [Canis lupus familiaris]|uniref:intraflagellar transport-associated protein isoform X1 n=1 Tax=Canis lupus familiaris TaxID=9615 RepID=UPI000BAA0DFF|nr:intraflagellar transport-associated protein isoform X1 [Canis lupus familiaris]XP_022261016.1 intraflagellar transport-associated protein isoform X1 [Canis lupus familiaris]XP_022261017.1 intraflagellar transport-associated protein isoform X1 [Canis lupus familiaris]XP_022261018.1 intraflagellar transport-associated protein isoform X1 [Canis lupus familiaris]XP_022261019.1 intraflagellar transport-associated protein isoform X1 [Canis lupus familiaris]XP_038280006.1 intraflagellar transport-|eukprot:XP_022261015.1 uncharacterized protein C11orf74 homolog isoform X1 [Canis lupus familiaris]
MPAQISELEVMDEDRLIEEVLDKFVNCHEQTYEEFLSTFTHLSKEKNVTKRGACGTESSENICPSVKLACENEPNVHHPRNKAIFLRVSSQCSEEEQIVIDEGQKVGSSFQGDLNRAGKVKVDNFLDLEDLDVDEEIQPQMSKDLLLLPGEVEEDVCTRVPSYIPSVAQPLAPGVKAGPAVGGLDKQIEEIRSPSYLEGQQRRAWEQRIFPTLRTQDSSFLFRATGSHLVTCSRPATRGAGKCHLTKHFTIRGNEISATCVLSHVHIQDIISCHHLQLPTYPSQTCTDQGCWWCWVMTFITQVTPNIKAYWGQEVAF